jgi:aldehyde dehydrogenase (NAD+)
VERPLFDAVLARMAERYRALRVGPALTDPDVGPLISARQREVVDGYLALARGGVDMVAQARLGADLPPGGFYVPPTLLAPLVVMLAVETPP